ncbi:MAG: bifunctional folylpolyglutamate synthase/dihydrofolate synthase [Alphaproteobacteria bacterium]|nr:bifunctional folylpolyglutamate synthase/dihydrofolate synthase [Alphaproteobacteria bacterium]
MSKKTSLILERLQLLHPKHIDLSLNRIRRILDTLGNPEKLLPPIIHVAGTNGKGSTISYLRTILQTEGYKVHTYISPHLISFHERINIYGNPIDDDFLISLLEECEKKNGQDPITFFEITTAAAFLAFSLKPADFILLETGLGGRLDATNVIDKPIVSILTPISFDHMQFLGNTIEKIAWEKSGIMKKNSFAVIGPQLPAAENVFLQKSQDLNIQTAFYNKEWTIKSTGQKFSFTYLDKNLSLPFPSLQGSHQQYNAGMALTCCYYLKNNHYISLSDQSLITGITTTKWPGRLQKLEGTLAQKLPSHFELWLDGGHNPAAGEVLVDWAKRQKPFIPLYLIMGMLTTKDVEGFLRPFVDLNPKIYALKIDSDHESFTAKTLTEKALKLGLQCEPCSSVDDALNTIQNTCPALSKQRILICGSLYLAGLILQKDQLAN